ncbi:MAG: GLUG motif-containing protein, partial [Planctomycetota bacterium]
DMLGGMSAWEWETVLCEYSGGSGTADDPYRIATAENLIALGETPEDYDRHFILTAHIDLDPNLPGRKVFDRAVIAPDVNRMPWGIEGTPFTGVFDGNGYTISHLTVNGPGCLGLFGWLRGEVKDLGVVRVNISGSEYCVAALVGASSGTIADCYASGTVSGSTGVGGLVGQNGVRIGNRFDALVFGGYIEDSYSNCDVMGVGKVGGLVGYNYAGRIARCYSSGAVASSEPNQPIDPQEGLFGGLVGDSEAGADDCFWDIEASGLSVSAGGTGKTTAQMQTATTFLEAGWDFAGETDNGPNDIWKISEGLDYPRLWWEQYGGGSGDPNDPFLIYTAEQLNQIGLNEDDWDKHFVLMADIDMSTCGCTAYNIIGRFSQGEESDSEPFTGAFDGNGHVIRSFTYKSTGEDNVGLFAYLSGTVRDLGLIDVNINAAAGRRIGALAGIADSSDSGFVSNCYVTGYVSGDEDVGGLIGYSGHRGIEFCHSSAEVTGRESVGGLVGYCADNLELCYSVSTVQGDINVGGLVGTFGGDNLGQCYSISIVEGRWAVGGLAGKNNYNGSIEDCYTGGSVSGQTRVGGLVGIAACDPDNGDGGQITRCYCVASLPAKGKFVGALVGANYATIDSSFWDVEASGLENMCGFSEPGLAKGCDDSFGKTTAEMQTAGTFFEAGWDFADETENGTADIWWILEGRDYPRLWWEAGN